MNYSTLIQRIEDVFPKGVAPSYTLYDGQRDDDYGLFSSKYEAIGRTLRWHEIRTIDLEETPFAMIFLPRKNQHYYFPAYLHLALIAWEKKEGYGQWLERGIEYVMRSVTNVEFTSFFTREQLDFVIDFLKVAIIAEPGYSLSIIEAILNWECVRDQLTVVNQPTAYSLFSDVDAYKLFANQTKPNSSLGLYAAQAKAEGRSLTTEEWEIDQQISHETLNVSDVQANPKALIYLSPLAYLYFLPAYLQAYNFLAWNLAENFQPFYVLAETLEGKSGPDREKVREATTLEQRRLIVGFLKQSISLRPFTTMKQVDARLEALRFWLGSSPFRGEK